MPVLEMRDAAFSRGGVTIAGPLSIVLEPGQRASHACANAQGAATAALMAAGIVKATTGGVFVCQFDPRIQPAQAKRFAGYVPHEAVRHEFPSFTGYVEYRAKLWGLERIAALARAAGLRETLSGVHEAFAFPLIGALLANPKVLVLDRPQSALATRIAGIANGAAIFSTHVCEVDASWR